MSKVKIMLDAGHYKNYNRSNVYKPYYEGNMAWKWQKYLKEELEKYEGIEVGVTRTSISSDLELYNRGYKAKGYDMFISGHSNACDDESVDRVVVIKGTNTGDKLSEKFANAIKECMGIKTHQIYTRKKSNGDEYYGVLRGAKGAGVTNRFIFEHGFHTNTKTAKWLYSDENIKKLAVAEAKVIAEHFDLHKKTEPKGFYRIVAGSYSSYEVAQQELAKLKEKGVNAFLTYCEE